MRPCQSFVHRAVPDPWPVNYALVLVEVVRAVGRSANEMEIFLSPVYSPLALEALVPAMHLCLCSPDLPRLLRSCARTPCLTGAQAAAPVSLSKLLPCTPKLHDHSTGRVFEICQGINSSRQQAGELMGNLTRTGLQAHTLVTSSAL